MNQISEALQTVLFSIRKSPLFTIVTLVSWVLTCFHITAATGSWITYSFTAKSTFITSNTTASTPLLGNNASLPAVQNATANPSLVFNTTTEIKIGLFNAAANNSWHLAPYSSCVAQIDKSKIKDQLLQDHYMFCNAQLANGVLILISLIASFIGSCILTAVLLRSLSLPKVLLSKRLCLYIFVGSALINTIAFSLGATILYRLTSRDFPGSYYGIGFIAAILNAILSLLVILGVYFFIDAFGTTRSFSVLVEHGLLQDNDKLDNLPPPSTTTRPPRPAMHTNRSLSRSRANTTSRWGDRDRVAAGALASPFTSSPSATSNTSNNTASRVRGRDLETKSKSSKTRGGGNHIHDGKRYRHERDQSERERGASKPAYY